MAYISRVMPLNSMGSKDYDTPYSLIMLQVQRHTIEKRLFSINYILLAFVTVVVLWAVLINHGKRRRMLSTNDVSSLSQLYITVR